MPNKWLPIERTQINKAQTNMFSVLRQIHTYTYMHTNNTD